MSWGADRHDGWGCCGAAGASDGRVRRNIHWLATLWMTNGILRLTGIAWMMIFGRMFFPFMRGPFAWPFGGRWGWDIPFLPLGTALGIYTLWVLVPEPSGREYERLAQGGQMNSATASLH